jgi:hypothetical protein
VDVEKSDDAMLARITHTGGSNFAIWSYGADGEKIDLLVNTIGNYNGTVPLDWLVGEHTTRFEVSAGGDWEIRVDPIDTMRSELVPSTFTGTGDDVVLLANGKPDLLKIDASTAEHNFAIWAYDDSNRDLVVNEIAPYQGTVIVSAATYVLVIQAEGPWQIEVTER